MKAEITQNKKAFEPIEVKITIESLEELIEMCKRLNICIDYVNGRDTYYPKIDDGSYSDLFLKLNDLYDKLKWNK